MTATYAGMALEEIFNYDCTGHELHSGHRGEAYALIQAPEGPFVVQIHANGSRSIDTGNLLIHMYRSSDGKNDLVHCEATKYLVRWYINGKLGRAGGLPAIERGVAGLAWYEDGVRYTPKGIYVHKSDNFTAYYTDGKLGREGGLPAIEYTNGTREWYRDGKLGRAGGLPAVEQSDGTKEWYIDGAIGREGGLPSVLYSSGRAIWYNKNEEQYLPSGVQVIKEAGSTYHYIDGLLGREGDLPAIEKVDGTKIWCTKNDIHRENGLPAIVYPDCRAEWYIDGVRYTPSGTSELLTEGFTARYSFGRLHSVGGLPAIEYRDNRKDEFYINGQLATKELVEEILNKSLLENKRIM